MKKVNRNFKVIFFGELRYEELFFPLLWNILINKLKIQIQLQLDHPAKEQFWKYNSTNWISRNIQNITDLTIFIISNSNSIMPVGIFFEKKNSNWYFVNASIFFINYVVQKNIFLVNECPDVQILIIIIGNKKYFNARMYKTLF